jgi:hypothetical protein
MEQAARPERLMRRVHQDELMQMGREFFSHRMMRGRYRTPRYWQRPAY